MYTNRKKEILSGIILAAAFAVLPFGIEQVQAKEQMDGVMGQSLMDETVYNAPDLDTAMYRIMGRAASPALLRATADYTDEFLAETWMTEGNYTDATYYHTLDYEGYTLLNGVDVSWWQGGGRGSTKSNLDWSKAHDNGIDYVFVRAGSRDTEDGSIYEDTCADAHIQGALENDINVGLYIFSQALTEDEAREEAQFVLDLVEEYDWDVSLPIVIDREAGSYKRLTGGKLSKAKETAAINAFSQEITAAGYKPMVYASYSWINNYINTDSLADYGCGIWIARYNNTTTSNSKSGVPFADVPYDYEFWQYSSTAHIDGYSGNIDADFWYKDTSAKTKNLQMTANAAESISLKWSKAGDAHGYRIYRYDEQQGKYVAIKSTSGTNCTDTGLKAGETYQYRVRCYWTIGGTNYYGKYSDTIEETTLPAKISDVNVESQASTSITLGWDEIYGATAYRLYMYNEDSGKFEKLTDVGADMTSFKVAGLASAKEYQFKVRAIKKLNGKSYLGTSSAAFSAVTKPSKLKGTSVETVSSTSLDISWDKVARATGYQIYRLDGDTGKYVKIATVKNNKTFNYTDTGLATGTKYTYKVRAYLSYDGAYYYGVCGDVKSAVTKPAKTKGLSLTTKSSSVTLKWNKQSGVTGYQIYRLNSKTGKYEKIATVKGADKVSYKDTTVKKGTTYSYKVRAYISCDGSNYYGAFSEVSSLKAK